jgi:betaine reductase
VKIVHYLNQFFAGLGGEDSASSPPGQKPGATGPGRKLASLLGSEHEVVATVYCGDNYAASNEGAAEEIFALIMQAGAEMVIAGPAFTSGRYGIACARVAAAAAKAGLPALAAMHADNPGVPEAPPAQVVACGLTARQMGAALEAITAAVPKVAAGEALTAADGGLGQAPRRNRLASANAATRAVDLALKRLAGDLQATEIPLPDFGAVTPAAPVDDPSNALVALLTEGGFVPMGNPDRLESARATKWLRYPLPDAVAEGQFQSVHGGFSTVVANADPNRILPLDVARELVDEGRIGRLHTEYLTTTGNGTPVASASRYGVEWAANLRKAGVQAAILTST